MVTVPVRPTIWAGRIVACPAVGDPAGLLDEEELATRVSALENSDPESQMVIARVSPTPTLCSGAPPVVRKAMRREGCAAAAASMTPGLTSTRR